MILAQPIFHALGLLVKTVQREEDSLWSHRCSDPVEALGHEHVVERGTCVGVGKCGERTSVIGKDDKVA